MQLKSTPEDFIVVEIANHELSDGPYALFELTKRNLSTERAIAEVADYAGIQRRFIGYAGAKDSRALTKQYVSIKADEVLVERLKKMNRNSIVLRYLGRTPSQLGLGMLAKNRFEITARMLKEENLHPLTSIPNYFDEQRFSVANAQIGKLIIKSEYLKAVQLIMDTDREIAPKMSEYLETRPNDAVSALRFVPRNILLMYVHAYQSLLWNEVLSRYIKEQDAGAVDIDGPVKITVPSKELGAIDVPVFGFGTEDDPVFGKWYGEILMREDLEPRDFVVRSLPFLTVEGGSRQGFFQLENFEAGPREPDELNPGFEKQRLTFTLPKACYATMAIKVLYRVGRVQGEKTT